MDTTEANVTLAVDAMGSDHGPKEVIAGISQSLITSPRGTRFLLFGREEELNECISSFGNFDTDQVEVRHAPEVVGMDEKPIAGIKGKKRSSMSLALQSVKDKEAQALLSCGNTGCLMAGSTIRLRTLEGVERPALCTIWPGRERYFTLLDAGANPLLAPKNGMTSLIWGAAYGETNMVMKLLAKGADVHAVNNSAPPPFDSHEGSTALHFAAEGGYDDVCCALISAGADVNSEDRWFRNCLELAVSGNKRKTGGKFSTSKKGPM